MTSRVRLVLVGSLLSTLLLISPCSCIQVDSGDPSIPYNTYRLYTAKQIASTLRQWQLDYPNFLTVQTAQDEFGLQSAGSRQKDCPFDGTQAGCLNYFAVLQDYVSHPEGSASSNRLPTVLLSGELHGNERVGPTSVMAATQIMLEATTCESLPRYYHGTGTNTNTTQYTLEMTQALLCQEELSQIYGITKTQRQWMARLLKTRRIIVVPTANALGYYRNSRYEDDVDPNRDFPYDQLTPDTCMKSIAARVMNELFRKYRIMNSFTFHGGTEMLGYEWGNPTWYGTVSPDDIAQDQLAHGYVQYGGSFEGSNGQDHPLYEYADMNSIIYYVRGGFEDFAYAGSWEKDHMLWCEPTSYGGYTESKTQYDDGMLRSFNMLVETSWNKVPNENDLGTTQNVLFGNSEPDTSDGSGTAAAKGTKTRRTRQLRGGIDGSEESESRSGRRRPPQSGARKGGPTGRPHYNLRQPPLSASERNANGHIPRNLRLSVASIDLVQPYLSIRGVNDLRLVDDVIPLQEPGNKHSSCNTRTLFLDHNQQLITQALDTGLVPVVSASLSKTNPTISWSVGGAITIDETDLWIAVLNNHEHVAPTIPNGAPWLSDYICGNPYLASTSVSHRLDSSRIKTRFIPLGSPQTGTGFFSATGAQPPSNNNDDDGHDTIMGPLFSMELDLQALNITQNTTLLLLASAKVDSSWLDLPTDAAVGPANTQPQSHMVQARTNDDWYFESSDGYVIQGQSQWFSNPILLHVVDDATAQTLHHNDRTQNPLERPEFIWLKEEDTTVIMAAEEEIQPTATPTESPTTSSPTTTAPTTATPTGTPSETSPTTASPTAGPTAMETAAATATEAPTSTSTMEEWEESTTTTTNAPSEVGGYDYTMDPSTSSTTNQTTVDPTTVVTTTAPTTLLQVARQFTKRSREQPRPNQSLADFLRSYNRLTKDDDDDEEEGPQQQQKNNPGGEGGNKRKRQRQLQQQPKQQTAGEQQQQQAQQQQFIQSPQRAKRIPLQDLPPRP